MCVCFFFFFNDTATTEIYTLSLHDALPISRVLPLAEEGEELVAGAHAERHHDAVVAVVGVDVVVAGAQVVRGADLAALLALARDHERRLSLAVQDPGALVHPAGEEHVAVDLQQVFLAQTQGLVAGPGLLDSHRPPPKLRSPREERDRSSTSLILANHPAPQRPPFPQPPERMHPPCSAPREA